MWARVFWVSLVKGWAGLSDPTGLLAIGMVAVFEDTGDDLGQGKCGFDK